MTLVQDILDVDNLTYHIAHGNITERFHPEFPELVIYNYAPNVAYARLWDHETLTCRGLIVNLDTQEVVARPFKKFFNYGEGDTQYDLDAELYYVGDKADGSLGIGYVRPDGRAAIATRGSFMSDQAIHATENLTLNESLAIGAGHAYGWTRLFEIIYPENRIVLNYGDRDELIFLGHVEKTTGNFFSPNHYRETYEGVFRDAISAEPRPNAEGYVVWFDQSTAVKIKQADYIALHRIVTGLNKKTVWNAIKEGPHVYDEMAAQLPDELFEWAKGVRDELLDEFAIQMKIIDSIYLFLCEAIDFEEDFDRGAFARQVKKDIRPEYQKYMFLLIDGKDIHDKIWASLEPKGGER